MHICQGWCGWSIFPKADADEAYFPRLIPMMHISLSWCGWCIFPKADADDAYFPRLMGMVHKSQVWCGWCIFPQADADDAYATDAKRMAVGMQRGCRAEINSIFFSFEFEFIATGGRLGKVPNGNLVGDDLLIKGSTLQHVGTSNHYTGISPPSHAYIPHFAPSVSPQKSL